MSNGGGEKSYNGPNLEHNNSKQISTTDIQVWNKLYFDMYNLRS